MQSYENKRERRGQRNKAAVTLVSRLSLTFSLYDKTCLSPLSFSLSPVLGFGCFPRVLFHVIVINFFYRHFFQGDRGDGS